MKYNLTIKPALKVEDRHRLQDILESLGYKVYGSGQMINCSECDISFEGPEEKPTKAEE